MCFVKQSEQERHGCFNLGLLLVYVIIILFIYFYFFERDTMKAIEAQIQTKLKQSCWLLSRMITACWLSLSLLPIVEAFHYPLYCAYYETLYVLLFILFTIMYMNFYTIFNLTFILYVCLCTFLCQQWSLFNLNIGMS